MFDTLFLRHNSMVCRSRRDLVSRARRRVDPATRLDE
jgi:hypothetical protein